MILDYSWPGNVRELENSIEHAVVLAKGSRIEVTDLPATLRSIVAPVQTVESSLMFDSERALLERVLGRIRLEQEEGGPTFRNRTKYPVCQAQTVSDFKTYLAIENCEKSVFRKCLIHVHKA